jgi:hypothetical protein
MRGHSERGLEWLEEIAVADACDTREIGWPDTFIEISIDVVLNSLFFPALKASGGSVRPRAT